MRLCAVCRAEFESNYSQSKTCGDERCKRQHKKKYNKKWTQANRGRLNSYKRVYHASKDRARVAEKQKARRKSPEGKQYRNKLQRERLRRDAIYRAKRSLRKRLWEYKKKLGTISMTKIIGCSWEEFKIYMESMFHSHPDTGEPMSWSNYGKDGWEIDHIVPLCLAKDTDMLIKLSHYTNLRPLWRLYNNLKSAEDLAMLKRIK